MPVDSAKGCADDDGDMLGLGPAGNGVTLMAEVEVQHQLQDVKSRCSALVTCRQNIAKLLLCKEREERTTQCVFNSERFVISQACMIDSLATEKGRELVVVVSGLPLMSKCL